MKTLSKLTIVLIVVVMAACVINKEVTPQTKLLYMYQVYNAQHQDYLNMAANPNLTEDQKAVLRVKRPILTKLQSLISLYDLSVTMGAPDAETEQQIYELLNSLNQ